VISYRDGTEIRVGDEVLLEGGKTPGTIVHVVHIEQIANFNVDEAGVMIKSAPFGLVFIPVSLIHEGELVFVRRSET
jgi:hypothetical protein